MAQLPFLHHGRPCPVLGLVHKACLPSGISEATTMDGVGGLGIRQEPHTLRTPLTLLGVIILLLATHLKEQSPRQ